MSTVKRLKTFAILIFFAVLLSLGGGIALAEDTATAVTDYPVCFNKYVSEQFTNVFDYAVHGSTYAFAVERTISVIEIGGGRREHQTQSIVTALDCDENGNFYYKDGSGATFALADDAPAQHEFKAITTEGELVGDFYYYLDDDNNLTVFNKQDKQPQTLENYQKVKLYGGTVYALLDGVLCKFDGVEASPLGTDVYYTDVAGVKNVCFGDTAESLKTLNAQSLHYITLKSGADAYVTEVDLNLISENPQDTFIPAEKTYKIGETGGPAVGREVLLLAVSGNAYVFTMDGKGYIMNKEYASAYAERAYSAVAEDTTARVSEAKASAYSSPFICNGTKICALTKDAQVKIVGKVESLEFYVAEFTNAQGEKQTGYIPYGFLSAYGAPVEGEPPAVKDPAYSQDNSVKTVVLVIVVVALILIALGYLVYASAAAKRKGKKEAAAEVKNPQKTE